jgi:hypothetical protein
LEGVWERKKRNRKKIQRNQRPRKTARTVLVMARAVMARAEKITTAAAW